eukprot:NODE_8652_length_1479_cov_3.932692.p1 GENE.NODE_8652_length_1479_cov_3.932692~~NODE_8652_length_1479_cov_3.932692.p1  ORF type:complete len:354 (+),score=99.21 NODE_8652_length_1479_cov_3.932692:266-1327(+)
MGAATAVMAASVDASIAAAVLDSPFADLRTIALELVEIGQIGLPSFFVSMALKIVRSEVRQRAGFEMLECAPIQYASSARCPALFAHAEDDEFVLIHHSEDLHAAWGGEKELVSFNGGHNGIRPDWFYRCAVEFLRSRLFAGAAPDRPPSSSGSLALGSPPRKPGAVRHASPQEYADAANLMPRDDAAAAPPPMPSFGSGSAVAASLEAMGFDAETAAAATKRFSTVDAALDWILSDANNALSNISGRALRPPTTAAVLVRAPPLDAGDGAARGGNGGGGESGGGGGAGSESGGGGGKWRGLGCQLHGRATGPSLASDLENLGFDPSDAREAARRCSSIEACVEWLVSCGASR